MAGIKRDTPIPTDIKLHQKSRFVELFYENGERYELDFEFLRVFTPSAEARGHGPARKPCKPASGMSKWSASNRSAPTHCALFFPTDTTAASTHGTCSTTSGNIMTSYGRNT